MRRPYSTPCISNTPGTLVPPFSTLPFRPSGVVRLFGALRDRGWELSIPARLLTKGDRPVTPPKTGGRGSASHRVGDVPPASGLTEIRMVGTEGRQ